MEGQCIQPKGPCQQPRSGIDLSSTLYLNFEYFLPKQIDKVKKSNFRQHGQIKSKEEKSSKEAHNRERVRRKKIHLR